MKLQDCKLNCKLFHEDETWEEWKSRTGYGDDVYKKVEFLNV